MTYFILHVQRQTANKCVYANEMIDSLKLAAFGPQKHPCQCLEKLALLSTRYDKFWFCLFNESFHSGFYQKFPLVPLPQS